MKEKLGMCNLEKTTWNKLFYVSWNTRTWNSKLECTILNLIASITLLGTQTTEWTQVNTKLGKFNLEHATWDHTAWRKHTTWNTQLKIDGSGHTVWVTQLGTHCWNTQLEHTAGTHSWNTQLEHTAGTQSWEHTAGNTQLEHTAGTHSWNTQLGTHSWENTAGTHSWEHTAGNTQLGTHSWNTQLGTHSCNTYFEIHYLENTAYGHRQDSKQGSIIHTAKVPSHWFQVFNSREHVQYIHFNFTNLTQPS
jgi:hypothetical protein